MGICSCQYTYVFSLHLTTGIPQYERTMIYLSNPLLTHIGSSISLLPSLTHLTSCLYSYLCRIVGIVASKGICILNVNKSKGYVSEGYAF